MHVKIISLQTLKIDAIRATNRTKTSGYNILHNSELIQNSELNNSELIL